MYDTPYCAQHIAAFEPHDRLSMPIESEARAPSVSAVGPVRSGDENSVKPLQFAPLYERLAQHLPTAPERAAAAAQVRHALDRQIDEDDEVPESPEGLIAWMQSNVENVHDRYQRYLEERKQGGARRYFFNRAHALYFLRNAAPTKLVDGSWLYGLCAQSDNARFSDLVRTYTEELGDGAADKNHVKLYRDLLTRYGIDPIDGLPDIYYYQGLVQLALGWNADQFLPEIIGFNLGYEQLPLHLLITAYELNELGIDPYYFTLHITVDNADNGHARRACMAALDVAPRLDDGGEYWHRVRAGAKLNRLGVGTTDLIEGFDIDAEVARILAHKAPSGHGAHSDYCKLSGRSVNDWLAEPESMRAFMAALEAAQWIKKGQPAEQSRFWQLLQGERAEMFGVFSPYELQVLHDWIRGPLSADGQPYDAEVMPGKPVRQMNFRVAQRLKLRGGIAGNGDGDSAVQHLATWDADLEIFEQRLPTLAGQERRALIVQAMAPALHWTPAGLLATRLFLEQ